jgi:hypothetical protein
MVALWMSSEVIGVAPAINWNHNLTSSSNICVNISTMCEVSTLGAAARPTHLLLRESMSGIKARLKVAKFDINNDTEMQKLDCGACSPTGVCIRFSGHLLTGGINALSPKGLNGLVTP